MNQISSHSRFNRHIRAQLVPVLCGLLTLVAAINTAGAGSLQFYGQISGDVGRVKFLVGDTDQNATTNDPGPPLDVGATDFTIEFWIKTSVAGPSLADWGECNSNTPAANFGAVIADRDRHSQGRSYIISMTQGRIAFGVEDNNESATTICSARNNLDDSNWHHIAVQRHRDSGLMQIYIDGVKDGENTGPSGDISYPDDGVPENFCSYGGNSNQPCVFSDPYLVIGAEKHDAWAFSDPVYPGSYSGHFTELRVSNILRYSDTFTLPSAPFATDVNTVGLYHFNEGSGTIVVNDSSGAIGNPDGEIRVGGNSDGPTWSTDTPFNLGTSPGTIAFVGSSVSVNESAGSVTINVNRSGGNMGAATVDYATANGTATAGADYTATMNTLSWNDDQAGNRGITVPIINDTEPESDETFTVALSNVTGGAALGSPNTFTVTIVDNDSGGGSSSSSSSSGGSGSSSSGGSGSSSGGPLHSWEIFIMLLSVCYVYRVRRGYHA